MFSTTLALIAATLATTTTPVTAAPKGGYDPITASYNSTSRSFCLRSGWNRASFATNRRVRSGECRTAAEWRLRGLAFDTNEAAAKSRRAADEIAAR